MATSGSEGGREEQCCLTLTGIAKEGCVVFQVTSGHNLPQSYPKLPRHTTQQGSWSTYLPIPVNYCPRAVGKG